jgi:lipid-binding SYLF domain-containing protein
MKEAMGVHSHIPQGLLQNAHCVIVIPSVMKGAFGLGGSYGRGVMTCRGGTDSNGPWTAPTMMALEGASLGFQVGGQATDFVLLVMSERGARSILSGKGKIGGDVSGSAGPVGRNLQANLDVYFRTSILTYSRSRGLFGGVSLDGSTLRPDNKANEALYGRKVAAKAIAPGKRGANSTSAEEPSRRYTSTGKTTQRENGRQRDVPALANNALEVSHRRIGEGRYVRSQDIHSKGSHVSARRQIRACCREPDRPRDLGQ